MDMSQPPRSIRPPSVARPSVATLAARGVRAERPPPDARASSEPLYQTSVFEFESIAASQPALDQESGYVYARYGLPNARSLEATVCALEGAEQAVATATGMSALLCAVLASTKPGDRVLCQRDAYGGTRALFETDLPRLGLSVEYVDVYDPAKVADQLARGAALLLVETLSNPLVREADVAALSWHCRASQAVLCVDNTFASPVFRRPIADGADLVMHSATKFLGGHHDLCAGVLAGARELVSRAQAHVTRMGLSAPAFDTWLAVRGLKTLDVRMQRAQDNARALAAQLGVQPCVRAVHYPGWGAILSFDVGDRARAEAVVTRAKSIPLTPSLGGTETSFSHPASSSHRALSPAERAALGIGEGLLRLSVGIEDVDDLWYDLQHALKADM